jgi:hypothetical protein
MNEAEWQNHVESYRNLADKAFAERDRYKAMCFDAWRSARQQTKGMQRMARRIKALRSQLDAAKAVINVLDRSYVEQHRHLEVWDDQPAAPSP